MKKSLTLSLLGSALITTAIAPAAKADWVGWSPLGGTWRREAQGFAAHETPIKPPQLSLGSRSQARADADCTMYVFTKKGQGFHFRDLQRGNALKLGNGSYPFVWAHLQQNVCVINNTRDMERFDYPLTVVNP
jgi:hypothetical protein